MKKLKKKPNEMMTTESKVSLAVSHGGIFDEGKELVVTCGYSTGGEFGYFLCKEEKKVVKGITTHYYTDQTNFIRKANGHTYSEVLEKFKEVIETHKKQ